MARKARNGTVVPRSFSRSTQNYSELTNEPSKSNPADRARKTFTTTQLRQLAALLRTGAAPERAEIAGQLEAWAEGLRQPGRPGRPVGTVIAIAGRRREWTGTRAEAAERLGITVESLDCQLSRKGGAWTTTRPDKRGGLETLRISRRKLTKSPQS